MVEWSYHLIRNISSMKIVSNFEFWRDDARGNVSRTLHFVASCIEISLYVGKCLRTEDIFGCENVSTVRRGRRSRVVKEGEMGNERDSRRCKSSVAITKRFLFVCVTYTANNQRLPCAYALTVLFISMQSSSFKMMNWTNVDSLPWRNLN